MNATELLEKSDFELLSHVAEIDLSDDIAYNIRKDGKLAIRNITDDVSIVNKEDGTGIDIYVKDNTKRALVLIPVIVTQSGLTDIVYNDFHIGANANVTILAGCAIHNPDKSESKHNGIHRFYLDNGSNVKYVEKHYATGHKQSHKELNPVTEIHMADASTMDIDTIQIEGVDSSIRTTTATLLDNATLTISEKIMTNKNQKASTDFIVTLDGTNSSCHVISRSVAANDSKQEFISNIIGNAKCYGHVECDGILKNNGHIIAIPKIAANHLDANLIHEATIGKIAGEQLLKLMSLGLSAEESEKEIINGFLK